jgi:ABC-2 type transport system permease protein
MTVRWTLLDSWVIARRQLTHWVMEPAQIALALIFPVIFIVLFGYVFGSGMQAPEGGDYIDFLVPGLFATVLAFGISETATGITVDKDRGVMDRFRSMPMAPSAVVVGRSAADLVGAVVGLGLMVACGLVVGWRWSDGPQAALAAFALLLWLRLALQWVGIFLGLVIRTAEGVAAMQGLLFPFTILTSTYVAPELMPGWLGAIAAWNPLSATVTATRELFGNPGWPPGSWPAEHALELALAWPLLITAVFLPLCVRRYRALSR